MSVTNTLYENLSVIKHLIGEKSHFLEEDVDTPVLFAAVNDQKGPKDVLSAISVINEALSDIHVLAKDAGVKVPSQFPSTYAAESGDDIVEAIEGLQEFAIDAERASPLVLAVFETPSFEFTVISKSKENALLALKDKWKVHAERTGAEADYIDEYEDDIAYRDIVFDKAIYTVG